MGQLADARAFLEIRKAKPSVGAQEFDHASNVQCSAKLCNGSFPPIADIRILMKLFPLNRWGVSEMTTVLAPTATDVVFGECDR